MTAMQWNVTRSQRECAATGAPLEEGAEHYSALREEGDLFVREDYALEAWPTVDKAPFFSYWRTQVPPPSDGKRKRLAIDVEAFYTFFQQLEGATEPRRRLFRYLVALMLIRKRVLRLERIESEPASGMEPATDAEGSDSDDDGPPPDAAAEASVNDAAAEASENDAGTEQSPDANHQGPVALDVSVEDVLVVWDTRARSTTRVAAPAASETQLAEAQASLNEIFECQEEAPTA